MCLFMKSKTCKGEGPYKTALVANVVITNSRIPSSYDAQQKNNLIPVTPGDFAVIINCILVPT